MHVGRNIKSGRALAAVAGVVGVVIVLRLAWRPTVHSGSVTPYHAALREAALAQPWFQTLTLLRTELNCAPQWPRRAHPGDNMLNGSVQDCRDLIGALGHCDELADAKGLVLALDSGSHPQERGMALERCPTRQRAAVFFYARPTLPGSDGPVLAPPLSPSSPSPWVPIIIPAETFAQPGYSYPVTPAANMARCEAAKHAATFVGDPADQRWGRALSALARAPGFVVEADSSGTRVGPLLGASRFGLVPAGGQRSAFRLMETLAMGVAPVIIGDDWELPFEGILDWRTFSVRVPFRDIHRVPAIVADRRNNACQMGASAFEAYHGFMVNATQVVKGIEAEMRAHWAQRFAGSMVAPSELRSVAMTTQPGAELTNVTVLTPKNWHFLTTCQSFATAGYALADTEQHTSAAIFRTMMSTCTGGVFWVRAGSTHKPGSDIGAFATAARSTLVDPFVLITADGDNDIPGGHQALLEQSNLCGWYAQNVVGSRWHPKMFMIPIGFDLHTPGRPGLRDYQELRHSPEPERRLAVLVDHMSRSHPDRTAALSWVPRCLSNRVHPAATSAARLHKQYRAFVFGLSPRGNGVDCHRTWEMLYFGMIPVMLHSTIDPLFDGLPVVLLDKWEDLCTLDLRKTRDDLAKLLPVPERVFTTQHWYDRYRHKHTCKV